MTYQMYQVYDTIMAFFGVIIGSWGLYMAYKVATDKPKKDT